MQLLLSNYSWWGWSKRFSLSFVATGGIIYIVLKEFSTSFIFRFEWTFAPTINKKEKQVMDLWNFAYFLPLMCMQWRLQLLGAKTHLFSFKHFDVLTRTWKFIWNERVETWQAIKCQLRQSKMAYCFAIIINNPIECIQRRKLTAN